MSEINLGYMKCIDLSDNALTGQIPEEITSLVRLVSLNLSLNNLTGEIPRGIGQLQELNAFDLARNILSGEIPVSLSQIYRIGLVNLWYNNLSGKFPRGSIQVRNFDVAVYAGNPGLCGFPLKDCNAAINIDNEQGDSELQEGFTSQGFYFSMGLGYAVGISIVLGTLILNESWRFKCFNFLSTSYDRFYVMMAMKKAKLERSLKCSHKNK